MIKVEGIQKSYGRKTILNHVSFTAECGEQISFIGRNGCGKSTLIQIMAGIIRPDHGSITYFNQEATNDRKAFAKFCGYLPQENPLMEEMNVQDNISLWSGKRGRPEQRLIDLFDLADILKTPIEKLSGGMKRRVSIACSLVHWPPILLMDEPTTALDSYYSASIHTFMRQYRDMNGIIILATHDEKEINESNRCLSMNDGKM